MAISTPYALLRRTLAQRLNYWGGDISNNGPGTLSANGTKNTAIDTSRSEPDDEWDEAWIVLNPGSTNQVSSPTVWRRIAATAGWVQSTGTINIQGVWPAPYASGPPSGTPYELYKVFHPEAWLQAVNWAVANSYPHRNISVSFEVPQDYLGRIINWGSLVKNLKISDPTTPPVVTEVTGTGGLYQAGTYTFAYTLYNDLGETLQSPVVNVNFVGPNSSAQFASISVGAGVKGVHYYSSVQPNDSTLGLLSIGRSSKPSSVTRNSFVGENKDGLVDALIFPDPYDGYNAFPPIYNTTNVDVQELHHIMKRVNPGGYPEIWDDLGSDLYKPLGGKSIMLMYFPINYYNLKFMCTGLVPSVVNETDVTDEPPELLYAGAEYYLWQLLVKTSTIVNTNWSNLAKDSLALFAKLSNDYSLDTPRNIVYIPVIRTQY